MSAKDIYGLVAVIVGVTTSLNYIRTVVIGQTKPHAFTWGIWSLIFGIIFVAQWGQGAGAGSWTSVATGFICFTIFVLALFKGEKNITRSDWLALISALAVIPIWRLTHDALLAVVLATVIDAFAYYPTVRKTWIRPHEENFLVFAIDVVKWFFALLAMDDLSATTLIYPIFCIVANSGVALMIFYRRRQKT